MDEIEISDIYSGNTGSGDDDSEWSRKWSGKETGFPSPARDHLENRLSLDNHLIKRPAATFFVRVKGDGLTKSGIHSGDLLIVDRSLKPGNGNIVVVLLDGEYKLRRIVKKNGKIFLKTDNELPKNSTEITDELEYSVWGVVTYTIHQFV